MKYSFPFLITVGILLTTSFTNSTNITIPIIFKNIKNSNGRLSIGVFKDASSFEQEKPFKIILVSKKEQLNGTLKSTIEIESGISGFPC
jgi:uncharacterized protein (DUF2141 family)